MLKITSVYKIISNTMNKTSLFLTWPDVPFCIRTVRYFWSSDRKTLPFPSTLDLRDGPHLCRRHWRLKWLSTLTEKVIVRPILHMTRRLIYDIHVLRNPYVILLVNSQIPTLLKFPYLQDFVRFIFPHWELQTRLHRQLWDQVQ